MYGKYVTGFLVLVLVYGCSERQPSIQPLAVDAVILAFGDSLTAGTGTSKQNSYPAVLEKMINRVVINAGVPGELSEDGLKRLPALLDKYQPEMIIIAHGGNDIIRKLDRNALIKNIRAMITLSQQNGIGVVIIGIPRPGIFLASDDLYKNIALDYNIPIENIIMADVLSESELKSDTFHPNAKGYRLIAQSIDQLLRKAGAIQGTPVLDH